MTDLLLTNIGTIVSGDGATPLLDADTIAITDGAIESIGDTGSASQTIDVGGATVMPGLCDNHVHPVIGDYTPRQRQADFIESCLHGGVTTMLSAGEPHTPGRPKDPAGVKALTILAHKAFDNALSDMVFASRWAMAT